MVRATWLVLMLVGACAREAGQTETAASTCDPSKDELLGCCSAGATCTWASPVGERCTEEFTSFCAHGTGWCEEGVCRSFCSPVESPRCAAGSVELHGQIADLGDADQCLCVPN